MNLQEESFDKIKIWVQIWGLPSHCKTKAVCKKIAAKIRRIIEADVFISKTSKEVFLKAQVEYNVNNALREGWEIDHETDGLIWADIKYERLGTFCYQCGKVGHEEEYCAEANKEGLISMELGPWIKSSQIGIRLSQYKMSGKDGRKSSKYSKKKGDSMEEVSKGISKIKFRRWKKR